MLRLAGHAVRLRQVSWPDKDHVNPVNFCDLGKLLDSLGVPRDARDFAALGTRIKAGATLPAPVGVFPRYVEPKAD